MGRIHDWDRTTTELDWLDLALAAVAVVAGLFGAIDIADHLAAIRVVTRSVRAYLGAEQPCDLGG